VIALFAAAAAAFAASGIRQPRPAVRLWLPVERRWIEGVAAAAAQRAR